MSRRHSKVVLGHWASDADSLTDTGLIDFISSEQKHRGEPVAPVPPEDFYERLAALLEALETFGD